ncbi:hypothetical protein M408DRAFT_328516 [Serendipita vermifera MAFF 305830]|uniref:MYND-type domain-containing protein n=1 Tax=Serendipita vermifera MAFF 305830 TaxID=933852 RepID=A0A0C2WVF4_SERVB|nr:hypothetical protein M408DRAFT_328516 [Serendipita vermifera MAFF 305830]
MSHRHRQTKQKNEKTPVHTTFVDASTEGGKSTAERYARRMVLMNQVTNLRNAQRLAEAIPLQQEICVLDEQMHGRNSSSAGLSWNKLGEMQYENKDFAAAEVSLKLAVEIREGLGEDFDTSVSRDNLARIFEVYGRMEDAKKMRLRGRKAQNITCACYTCKYLQQGVGFDRLKACSRCKSVFYCSADCQKVDWKERHKFYCKAPETPAASTT